MVRVQRNPSILLKGQKSGIRKSVAGGDGFSDLGVDFFFVGRYMPHLNNHYSCWNLT
jgi:hypothetical protein